MRYAADNITQARINCAETFKLLEQYRIPPTPDLYKLVYDYVTDRNDIPKGEVDKAMKAGAEALLALVQKYQDMQESPEEGGVAETGQKISQKVEEILLTLASHSDSTGGFSEALTKFSGDLQGEQGAVTVEKLVRDIMVETHAMRDRTQQLEAELQASASAIDELQSSLNQVREEASTDPLTKIANRLKFDRTMTHEMSRAHDREKPLCLVMCDVDKFKNFNDTFGHQMGDQVLRMVGATLGENTKGRDLAARYGGEEFSLILPETELEDAVQLANTIRVAISGKRLIRKKTGVEISRVTVSFGAAIFRPGESAAELIERADEALYHAKESGRNQVCSERDVTRSKMSVAG